MDTQEGYNGDTRDSHVWLVNTLSGERRELTPSLYEFKGMPLVYHAWSSEDQKKNLLDWKTRVENTFRTISDKEIINQTLNMLLENPMEERCYLNCLAFTTLHPDRANYKMVCGALGYRLPSGEVHWEYGNVRKQVRCNAQS